uniref:Retrovirus-related Pol polyprotein from transposon TNT 1-94 n=1 Tax=Tanacetum cinerariifolium TaxID=118510 RepID=A0A6L2L6V0_TANCI|nr:retrovirus-related Pol polyprotein from transposon TNT 1-94 [Tanacetum cinerariifolium]
MSSAKDEYVATAGCYAQVLWIKSQLADYNVLYDKVPIFCDNTSAIAISNNPVLHSRIKHIDIRYHFIRDRVLKGDIELYFVPTDLQLADIFTKPLAESSFTRLVAELAKLSEEPEQSLIPPSREVNVDDTSDKSLFRASVQLVIQSKEATNLKTKKKKIPPSSKPKSPDKVRVILLKKQVAKTQYAEVTVATTDATKSLEASKLAEEQGNQPSTAEVVKVLNQHVKEEKDAEFVAMKEVDKEQSIDITIVEQLLDEADKLNKVVQKPPESPYDTKSEIKVVKSFFAFSGFHIADSDDTHKNKVSKSDHIFQDDNAFAERLSLPDHMDHISLKEQLPSLLSYALKDTLPQLFKDSIKSSVSKPIVEKLPHVEAQVQKNLQDQLPNLLLKPMYKEFNAFNKLESLRFVLLQKELSKSLHKNIKRSIKLKVKKGIKEVQDNLSCYTSTMATNSQHVRDLKVMFKDMVSLPEAAEVFKKANAEEEKWEKNNPIEEKDAQHPDQTKEEQILGANIADIVHAKKWTEHEAKKAKILEEYNHQISFRSDPLPITKISYTINSNKEATMKIIKGDNPLNLIVHPNFRLKSLGFSECLKVHALASKKTKKSNDMLLQTLREKFQWVMDQAKKLGLPPPPALATFGMTPKKKKRKRTQFLKEAFVTEDIRVDGINRNLIPPHGVMPIEVLVIKESKSGIFYMNRNTDIVFQREKVMKGLSECKALESNIRHIRVKDIIKKVKDYLKTYSSVRMDISWGKLNIT